MRKRIMIGAAILASALLLFCPTHSKADTLPFNLGNVFSGDTPLGSSPWLTAEFTDVSVGTVTLTLKSFFGTSPQLGYTQFVTEWDFNVNVSPTILTFDWQSGPQAVVSKGNNAFKADGDGYFDISFMFPTRNNDPLRFYDTKISVYTITGDSITASSFNVLNALNKPPKPPGEGLFHTAAHIQGIPGADSGWIGDGAPPAVPEPATMFLLGSGLIGLAGFARRRFKK